jgi:hypothetical protein
MSKGLKPELGKYFTNQRRKHINMFKHIASFSGTPSKDSSIGSKILFYSTGGAIFWTVHGSLFLGLSPLLVVATVLDCSAIVIKSLVTNGRDSDYSVLSNDISVENISS